MAWRTKTWGAVLVCLPLVLAAHPASAADCEKGLSQAKEDYENYQLEGIPELLEPCRGAGARRADKVSAYALLAQVYSVTDRDDLAREAVTQLLRLEPDYPAQGDGGRPPRFVRLVQEERERLEKILWTITASNLREDTWEAPGSMAVVTAEEIERRGYLDLEAVLHDLPGFDITLGNGDLYASLYPRGVRSAVNDGILLLVDGIEQDNPFSNATDLSRQYALTGIKQVEVLYGPAAGVYGPRAYAAVINVVTREPEEYLALGQAHVDLLAAAGSFGTGSVDLETSGRSRLLDMDWSFGGRSFHSDEVDLSGFADWDYRYDAFDYRAGLRLTGEDASRFLAQERPSPFYEVRQGPDGKPVVELSESGLELVRAIDRQFLADRSLTFSDRTEDWSVHGKVRLSGLTLGFQHWLRQEGVASWYGERFRVGSAQGGVLSPRQTSLFADYVRPMARARLRLSTRYQQSDVSSQDLTVPVTFASGRLGLVDLLNKCSPGPDGEVRPEDCPSLARLLTCAATLDGDTSPQACNSEGGASPSTRFTSQLNLAYDLTEKLAASFQAEVGWSTLPLVVNGLFFDGAEHFIGGPLQVQRTDTALAAQVSYRPRKTLRLVADGRLDRATLGGLRLPRVELGPLFQPRVALIWIPRESVVFKAVYSGGFKEPLNRERFSTPEGSRLLANLTLRPEKVESFELIAGWRSTAGAALEAALFEAHYHDLIEVRPTEVCASSPVICEGQGSRDLYVNGGEARIRGLQIQASLQQGPLSWSGNYTFTDPSRSDPGGGGNLRVADIARHRLNLGVDASWRTHWIADLRLSYVGERRTGVGTTVPTNPVTRVDAYQTVHATLSYQELLPGTTLQLIVDNLFDEEYEHPGVREAGTRFVASIPQPGRAIFLRLLTRFPASRSAR